MMFLAILSSANCIWEASMEFLANFPSTNCIWEVSIKLVANLTSTKNLPNAVGEVQAGQEYTVGGGHIDHEPYVRLPDAFGGG